MSSSEASFPFHEKSWAASDELFSVLKTWFLFEKGQSFQASGRAALGAPVCMNAKHVCKGALTPMRPSPQLTKMSSSGEASSSNITTNCFRGANFKPIKTRGGWEDHSVPDRPVAAFCSLCSPHDIWVWKIPCWSVTYYIE